MSWFWPLTFQRRSFDCFLSWPFTSSLDELLSWWDTVFPPLTEDSDSTWHSFQPLLLLDTTCTSWQLLAWLRDWLLLRFEHKKSMTLNTKEWKRLQPNSIKLYLQYYLYKPFNHILNHSSISCTKSTSLSSFTKHFTLNDNARHPNDIMYPFMLLKYKKLLS